MGKSMLVPELRFCGFGDGWTKGKLGNLIDTLDAGISVNSGDRPATTSEKGILKTSSVSSGIFNPRENKVVFNKSEIIRLKESVKADTVIISRMNTPALVGANAFINEDYPNLFLPDRLWAGKVNSSHNPKWVGILATTPRIRAAFSARATGTSGSMKNITKDDVLTVPVSYPSKKEQLKIASFLSSIDEKLNKLRRKCELLETYKRGVMQKIVSQELRFKKKDGGNFPDWDERQLSEFLIPTLREVDKPLEKYLAIGVRSHMKGTFQKPDSDPDDIAMETLYVVKENDLVVNITFAWEGAIAIVKKEDEGGLVSHRFPTYTFDRNLATHEFFRHVIAQERFKYMLGTISPGGAGRNRVLSKKDFVKLRWNIPCVEEQNKIADFISTLDKKIDEVSSETNQLETFKQGLLQKMFV